MHIDELETPVAVVDLDQLETNIERFQQYLDEHGVANRPHIKTHKIPAIAQMQVAAGAVGITCQKLGEAEIMADAGLDNIFLPYNIVGQTKLERLTTLAKRVTLSVTADSEYTVDGLAAAAQKAGVELTVLVECDTGGGRCGVQSPQAAADLAKRIVEADGLNFGGLMSYPSSDAMNDFIAETKAILERNNISVDCVTGGGTPQMWQAHQFPQITEHRAGMYIYGDRYTLKSGAMTLDDCSFKVFATVVSRPTEDRGILDAGSKTLSSDLLGLDGYGYILEYPDARIYGLSEEHGSVDFSACDKRPEIGERVTIIPNHCCPVNNLFNNIVGVRGDQVEVTWPVLGRGALQ